MIAVSQSTQRRAVGSKLLQEIVRLANEENRGIFVPASSISTRGQTDNVRSRRSQQVGRTLILTNGAKVRTASVIVDAQAVLPKIGTFNAS